jgi:ATP-dependent RNA helicase CshB
MENKEELLPFGSTALKKEILDILAQDGFEKMSPVQAKTIPLMIKNHNVLALAPTGTGKTLSYVLPIVNDLVDDGHVQAVVISPTVALLDQIKSVFEEFTMKLGFPNDAVKAVYAQSDFNKAKPDILLITPTLYKASLSHYPINELKRVIVDEGDMVVFDGFKEAMEALKKPRDNKMISFFSASLNVQDVKKVKSSFLIQDVVDVRQTITSHSVKHHIVNIRNMNKGDALNIFLKETKPFKSICFVSKKEDLFHLADELKEMGVHYLLVHGAMDKRDIRNTLNNFRKDEENLLLASDYVSRGLDIPDVECIISVNLPSDTQYYFHRAGRAGRFMAPGDSYIFYNEDDEDSVKSIYDLVRRGTSFDTYLLSQGSLKKSKGTYQFRNMGKKDRAESEELQKKIRHAVNKTKSTKVKPNYKKKVSKAVDIVKEKHRRKIVLTNIARSGGNATDYHVDRKRSTKRK